MTVIRFYYFKNESVLGPLVRQCAISDWYCKPSILSMLALKSKADFVTCDKYGCRQFVPHYSKFFPIHCWNLISYKNDLPSLFIEFDDNSSNSPWIDVDDFIFKLGFVE